MTDGKTQECRNGCGRKIFVSDRSGRWLPYDIGTDNKHDCPNFQQKRTTDFNRNKQMYAGPSQENQMQTDIANLISNYPILEQRVRELEHTVSGLGKALGEMSFKPANELVQEENDEIIRQENETAE